MIASVGRKPTPKPKPSHPRTPFFSGGILFRDCRRLGLRGSEVWKRCDVSFQNLLQAVIRERGACAALIFAMAAKCGGVEDGRQVHMHERVGGSRSVRGKDMLLPEPEQGYSEARAGWQAEEHQQAAAAGSDGSSEQQWSR